MTNENKVLTAGDLEQFSGTENYYRHMTGLIYTDGVKYLAEVGKAYWLLDEILFKTRHTRALQEWGSWFLVVNGSKATLRCEDGNDKELYRKDIEYTDFPLPEVRLWFSSGVLMLPSEY